MIWLPPNFRFQTLYINDTFLPHYYTSEPKSSWVPDLQYFAALSER